MASVLTHFLFIFFNLIIFSTFFITINGRFSEEFIESIPMKRSEKMSNLHFYFHEISSGRNPTAMQIAGPTKFSGHGCGITMVMDDPLTEGPEPTSKLVGRAQGIYSLAAQQESGILMVMNLVFIEGKFNGSALSILGRISSLNPVREMPVVGGTGLFRLARGYTLAKTYSFDAKTSLAVIEYNVSVVHF